jgi:hypothetical protein
LPIKIFSSVSAVLLSEVAITSPLRVYQGGLVAQRHNHIASLPSIETVGPRSTRLGPRSPRISYFSPSPTAKSVRGATIKREIRRSLLHCCNTRGATRTKMALLCADRLYFTSWTLKIKLQAHDPVKTG